jgi:hypothetical protein
LIVILPLYSPRLEFPRTSDQFHRGMGPQNICESLHLNSKQSAVSSQVNIALRLPEIPPHWPFASEPLMFVSFSKFFYLRERELHFSGM